MDLNPRGRMRASTERRAPGRGLGRQRMGEALGYGKRIPSDQQASFRDPHYRGKGYREAHP